MSEISTRRAIAPDFEAVAALLAELGRPPVTSKNRRQLQATYVRHIERHDTASLVAELSGKVVGFCSLERRDRLNRPDPQAWIPDLVVTEAARGRGVGTALLQAALLEAKAWGCRTVHLECGVEREDAHQFLVARGMQDAGKSYSLVL
ncbi:MAG TPA: GNAT family N-acetyltransferase [Symbiobacteriaceae bacterium]